MLSCCFKFNVPYKYNTHNANNENGTNAVRLPY